jgi:hypothetical protein
MVENERIIYLATASPDFLEKQYGKRIWSVYKVLGYIWDTMRPVQWFGHFSIITLRIPHHTEPWQTSRGTFSPLKRTISQFGKEVNRTCVPWHIGPELNTMHRIVNTSVNRMSSLSATFTPGCDTFPPGSEDLSL